MPTAFKTSKKTERASGRAKSKEGKKRTSDKPRDGKKSTSDGKATSRREKMDAPDSEEEFRSNLRWLVGLSKPQPMDERIGEDITGGEVSAPNKGQKTAKVSAARRKKTTKTGAPIRGEKTAARVGSPMKEKKTAKSDAPITGRTAAVPGRSRKPSKKSKDVTRKVLVSDESWVADWMSTQIEKEASAAHQTAKTRVTPKPRKNTKGVSKVAKRAASKDKKAPSKDSSENEKGQKQTPATASEVSLSASIGKGSSQLKDTPQDAAPVTKVVENGDVSAQGSRETEGATTSVDQAKRTLFTSPPAPREGSGHYSAASGHSAAAPPVGSPRRKEARPRKMRTDPTESDTSPRKRKLKSPIKVVQGERGNSQSVSSKPQSPKAKSQHITTERLVVRAEDATAGLSGSDTGMQSSTSVRATSSPKANLSDPTVTSTVSSPNETPQLPKYTTTESEPKSTMDSDVLFWQGNHPANLVRKVLRASQAPLDVSFSPASEPVQDRLGPFRISPYLQKATHVNFGATARAINMSEPSCALGSFAPSYGNIPLKPGAGLGSLRAKHKKIALDRQRAMDTHQGECSADCDAENRENPNQDAGNDSESGEGTLRQEPESSDVGETSNETTHNRKHKKKKHMEEKCEGAVVSTDASAAARDTGADASDVAGNMPHKKKKHRKEKRASELGTVDSTNLLASNAAAKTVDEATDGDAHKKHKKKKHKKEKQASELDTADPTNLAASNTDTDETVETTNGVVHKEHKKHRREKYSEDTGEREPGTKSYNDSKTNDVCVIIEAQETDAQDNDVPKKHKKRKKHKKDKDSVDRMETETVEESSDGQNGEDEHAEEVGKNRKKSKKTHKESVVEADDERDMTEDPSVDKVKEDALIEHGPKELTEKRKKKKKRKRKHSEMAEDGESGDVEEREKESHGTRDKETQESNPEQREEIAAPPDVSCGREGELQPEVAGGVSGEPDEIPPKKKRKKQKKRRDREDDEIIPSVVEEMVADTEATDALKMQIDADEKEHDNVGEVAEDTSEEALVKKKKKKKHKHRDEKSQEGETSEIERKKKKKKKAHVEEQEEEEIDRSTAAMVMGVGAEPGEKERDDAEEDIRDETEEAPVEEEESGEGEFLLDVTWICTFEVSFPPNVSRVVFSF